MWFVFTETVKRFPNMVCLWSRDGAFTYKEVQDLACQYAHFFQSKGVKAGDLVGFYLQNRPEFMIAWLGLWSIGCAPATINYNLTGDALVHCLKISEAKLVLVDDDPECLERVAGSKNILEGELGMELLPLDDALNSSVRSCSTAFPPKELALNMKGEFPAILLYTSGTTGMPKGCAFTMQRLHTTLASRRGAIGDKEGPNGDRWYSAMPLYHGTAALTMIVCMTTGVGVAIGKKFSVSNFWRDIRDSDSTIFVYVGEAARYLLGAPPSPDDRNHRVRCMYGNGLRPDVWDRFRERFGVPDVGEFFNSTEGVFSLFNYNRGPFTAGSVGHHGLLLRALLRNTFVPIEIDPNTGDALRDPKTGFAVRPSYEKGGEMIVAVPNEEAFQGYWRNPEATEKKFLRNVFKKGDIYYRSGDALRRQDDGRWYFLDRLGDTFRWKSENVYVSPKPIHTMTNETSATAEVAEALGNFPGVQEANVYGVLVPNHEGRAGCAALQLTSEAKAAFDFTALAEYARSKLPKYAVPVFLRVVENSTHTHNAKQNKVPLRDEGVDPAKIGTKASEGASDRFLWLPPGKEGYVEFKKEDWERLSQGGAKL